MKELEYEQGRNNSPEYNRTRTYMLCLSFVALGFIGGSLTNDSRQCNEQLHSSRFVDQQGEEILNISSRRKLGVEMFDKLDSLTSIAFSCNTRAAYDELTSLYARRVNLQEHRAKGEANRDRIAVISRKAGQAESSETAFRSCIGKMMPELLWLWDDDLRKNQLRIREKLSNKNYDRDGINFAVLEETADMLDSVQNP